MFWIVSRELPLVLCENLTLLSALPLSEICLVPLCFWGCQCLFATGVAAVAGVAIAGTGMVGPSTVSRVIRITVTMMTARGVGSQGRGRLCWIWDSRVHNCHCCGQGGWSHTTAGRDRGPWPLSKFPGPSDATARALGWGPSCVLEIKVPRAASAADGFSGAAGSAPQLGGRVLRHCLYCFPSPPTSRCTALWNSPASWCVTSSGNSVDLWMFYWL